MESKNLMEVHNNRLSYRGIHGSVAYLAALRIQNRINTGVTLVSVHVGNPRYSLAR